MRLGIVTAFVFLVTFSVFSQQADQRSDDWYQGKPIRSIVFEGLVNVRASELDGVTGPFIGRPFNNDTYWDILGRLYALEFFETISPSAVPADSAGNSVIIRFNVVERPTVSRINFTGNSGVRRSELLEAITLKVNDVATQVKLRLDEMAIINKYLEEGYPNVKVTSDTQPSANSTVVVTFHIDEGHKISIEKFVFEGNTVFSSRTLERQLSLRTKGLLNDGAFQEAKLTTDKQALVQYYRDRGYIDAVIIDDVREVRTDDKGNNLMTITFRLYEGRIYTFGGITFEGNRIFTAKQLSDLIYSRTGETINERRIQADLERVQDLYLENGYIFNRIEAVPLRDADAGILSFKMVIVERSRAHIENIIIQGNERTRESVILREIPLQVGDIFSKARIMDGLRNLYNLQYFSAITPETPPGSADNLMDLVISVEEQPTTDVQFGLTFSGSADPEVFPVSIMAQWNDRNFRGTGNMFGLELNAATNTQSLSVEYTQRWIFGLPLSGSFDLTVQHTTRRAAMDIRPPYFLNDDTDKDYAFPDGFSSYEEYVQANNSPADEYLMSYNQWRFSLGASTGYRWATAAGNLSLGGGIRIGAVINSYNSELYRPFDPVIRDKNNQLTPAFSVFASLSLDQRDIYYDPSRGYYLVQRLGWYGILPTNIEQEHYWRSDTKAEIFFTLFNIPVTDDWSFKGVLGLHTGLSFIFPQPGKPLVVERPNQLAVDGMFIGRGWLNEYNRKGLALWENWAEIRIPLAPGIIAWDFFFDAAGVKPTFQEFFTSFSVPDDKGNFFMRFSYGGGFRFTIPQFPFRFSLARRFVIRNGKVEAEIHRIGGDAETGKKGAFDFVVSFSMSTY